MTAAEPLISVIVPVYNAERYLHYCVDSILGQSYRNLEVILVDDGATDASGIICDRYAEQDSRVVVIHQDNGGIAKAQNTGLDNAHGEFIAFADNDDILDCHNIEYLLHALQTTGADMSKGRWRQFGVSQLGTVGQTASCGTEHPTNITVISEPLQAYQSVFCKSLRIVGELLGRHAEARYFNEANWCRLYRRELWEGLRFEPGCYAQDIRMAGPLYARMNKVADVDAVLYYWLQEPDSVTHSKRTAQFWHDNVTAAATNFRFTLDRGITPYRNYFGLTASVRDEKKGLRRLGEACTSEDMDRYRSDDTVVKALVAELPPVTRLQCVLLAAIRRIENTVYDRNVHNMR